MNVRKLLSVPGVAKDGIQPEFGQFVWANNQNRMLLLVACFLFLAQFILFKLLYPFANYFVDSYYYLESASNNGDVNTWPVAYSKFLRLVSVFTHSDTIVVAFQYFLIAGSGLFLFFTIKYFFQPKKIVSIILYVFIIFNPTTPYISNYISADSLFIGISLLWVSQLIWIICRPRNWQILIQALLLLFAFTVRYNGIYYPFIATLAFILCRNSVLFKLTGIFLGIFLVAYSILYTSHKMQEKTGINQFSAFGGWQMANNALYAYRHVKPGKSDSMPVRFAKLEQMVRQHMDTLSKVKLTRSDTVNTFFYLWSPQGPLVQYMKRVWNRDSTASSFKKWGAEGSLYKDYGLYLIRKHPVEFAEYFIWPNAIKYATPPIEFLGIYNMGEDSVDALAKEWFQYKSLKVYHFSKNNDVKVIAWYPVFSTLSNILFVISVIGFIFFKGMQKSGPYFPVVLLLIFVLCLTNMCFSIFASPITLRYQLFPIMLSFVFSMLTIRYIDLTQ